MIKKLRPFPREVVQVPTTPACCAEVQYTLHDRKWRLDRGQKEPFTCSRPSVVEIGGEHFCRLHGGHKALDMLLRGELIPAQGK